MELERLSFSNFRQFYGRQELEFSQNEARNVTVIHGANGSGKTTILNAFLWLFYDEVTLPRPGQIPNERALAEAGVNGTVEVEVSLAFDHDGRSYTATRTKEYTRGSGGLSSSITDERLSVEYVDEDGNHKRRGNPEDTLNNIMPERLREIFFFDGETIDQLSALGGQEKIQTAIQNIMGLTILERAERHLEKAQKRFEEEASTHGSDKLSELYTERSELEGQKESREEELADIESSKSEAEEERSNVNRRLSELEGSRGLQEERESLEDDIEGLEEDIVTIESEIASRISDDGYVPFAMPALEETAQMLREKRQRGEIPTEIKSQFVEDLLDIQECICGRGLTPGTQPYEEVATWRERGGSTELEEAAMTIAGRLSELGASEESLFSGIEQSLARRSAKTDTKTEKEERLSEISRALSDVDTENIAGLESRRATLDDDIAEYERRIGRLEGEIDDLDEQIETLDDEIDAAEERNEQADLARRRAQLAKYLRGRVEGLFDQYQDTVRQSVNDRVNDIFQEIIAKRYYARIGEDYSLKILKDVGTEEAVPVAKSTGERQVASLAFIASLVSLARERYESEEKMTYFKGGIYPMIMDSPFGSLDPEYQERVSAMLPEMAYQVIVLVTESQWSAEVRGEMGNVAGAEYSLEYYDPKKEDVEYERTEIVRTGGAY
jgi:DNA sulfur modification protein DndD